jgi:hypothetical protein
LGFLLYRVEADLGRSSTIGVAEVGKNQEAGTSGGGSEYNTDVEGENGNSGLPRPLI